MVCQRQHQPKCESCRCLSCPRLSISRLRFLQARTHTLLRFCIVLCCCLSVLFVVGAFALIFDGCLFTVLFHSVFVWFTHTPAGCVRPVQRAAKQVQSQVRGRQGLLGAKGVGCTCVCSSWLCRCLCLCVCVCVFVCLCMCVCVRLSLNAMHARSWPCLVPLKHIHARILVGVWRCDRWMSDIDPYGWFQWWVPDT